MPPGGTGFPNLNDDDWLWGGSLDEIDFTITHGVRNGGDPDARVIGDAALPGRWHADPRQIGDVADYVLSLSGAEHDAAAADRGQAALRRELRRLSWRAGPGQSASSVHRA